MYECLRKGLTKIDPGLVVVLVAALFVIQPFLQPGLPSIADAPIHLFRTAELDRCWTDGVYYPRWAPNLAFGYGYPLFLFAPPLPYFIIELFHILGITLETATKLLAIVCFLLGGVGMYLFVKEVLGAGSAMLAAVAYVYAPFQLREALIYGGNYPQLLAIAFFPFILWAVQRLIVTGRAVYIPVSAFLYGGLILSHNFHALVFSSLLLLYILFLLGLGRRWREWRRIVTVGSSLALGLGLTAFFWIPALYERQWCKAQEEFYISRSDFHLRFLDFRELLGFPTPLDTAVADPYMPFSLGPAILFLAIAGVLASSLGSIRLAESRFLLPREEKLHVAFFALVLVATVFMLLPISTPVWENVPFLATAEFPWRLMGVATLAIAFLAGASLRLWRDISPSRRPLALLMGSVLLVLLASAVYLYPPKPFLLYGSPSLAQSVRFEWVTQTIGTTTLGEYLPIWVKDVLTTSPLMPAYLEGKPIDKLDREALPDSAQVEVLGHTVVSDGYRFRSDEAFTARFHTFYFPGWRAYVDGYPVDIEIVEPRGLIAVPVPAGEHEVWVRFEGTPDRAISGFLSLLALASSLVVLLAAVLRRRGKAISTTKGECRGEATIAAHDLPLGQAVSLTAVLLILFFVKAIIIDPHTTLFRRRSPPGQVIGIGHPAHVNLGDKVLFLGYDLWDEKVRQGCELRLRLYWQALRPLERDYSSFVHLDARPDLTTWVGSDNPHPGDARAQIDIPTSTWASGTYIRDEHRLTVPEELPTAEYILRVGLYDQRTGERLPVLSEDGAILADAVALQPVHVLRAHPLKLRQLPYQEQFVLGDRIELLGYALNSTSFKAGEALEVTLYWRARMEVGDDYTVFVHLLDEEGGIRAQKDSSPLNGMYPTSSWLAGQVIEDPHTLLLEERLAPGRYRIAVGMYELETLQRLEAVDARGEHLPGDRIILGQAVEVKELKD